MIQARSLFEWCDGVLLAGGTLPFGDYVCVNVSVLLTYRKPDEDISSKTRRR